MLERETPEPERETPEPERETSAAKTPARACRRLVCALTLSVISGGFRMDWDPADPSAQPPFRAGGAGFLVGIRRRRRRGPDHARVAARTISGSHSTARASAASYGTAGTSTRTSASGRSAWRRCSARDARSFAAGEMLLEFVPRSFRNQYSDTCEQPRW